MRHMTKAELHCWYVRGVWPCGHGDTYIPGPRGGMMRNVACPTCGMKINVCDPEDGWRIPFGQVLHAPDGYVPPPFTLRMRVERFFRIGP